MENVTVMIDNETIHTMYNHVQVETTIKQIVLPIICAFAIVGTLLTVIVLSRKNMCTSTNCYLMALAIADLLFLVILATTLADKQFMQDSKGHYMYLIYVTYAAIFMTVFLMASIWMTVMLAVERYIAICHPFIATKVCTITKARIIIPIIFLVMFVSRMSNFWEHKVGKAYDNVTHSTVYYIESTELATREVYVKIFHWVVSAVLTSILPFILLLALNGLLIREVRKSTKYIKRNMMVAHNSNSVVQREELQITIMLISVIIVFFVCQAPYVTYIMIASLTGFRANTPMLIFHYVTMLLLIFKSSINFILYCWFSEKFWATLKRTFYLERCWPFKRNYASQNGNYYNLRRFSSYATKESTF